MIGIVLVGHGALAEAALTSIESVLGHPVPHMVAVSAATDDSLARLKERIAEAVRAVEEGDGTVILSDMFGDSATNVSLALARENNVQIVTGVNLPIVLKVVSARHSMTLEQLADFAVAYGREHILRAEPRPGSGQTRGPRPPR